MDLTNQPIGYLALGLFVLAYAFVIFEERLRLAKSKPVMLGAGLIWALVAWAAATTPGMQDGLAAEAFRHIFLEFAELFFFLIVAMSFVAAMTERNVFEAMRAGLVSRNLGYRPLFWITGVLSFFLSAVLDNLTTALIMSGVVMAVAAGNARFLTLAFINLVVAANAGGAWSAFGDITTLMVWQARKVEFFEFFRIFLPSLVNWLVPALCMHFALPAGTPPPGRDDADVKYGGWIVCALFAVTIVMTVSGKQFLHMPPVFGMMAGLGLLKLQGFFIRRRGRRDARESGDSYNVFEIIARAEWDTLLFFYGVLLCVGGLATMGFLHLGSEWLYGELGHTGANIVMGLLSAIVDNIPIMYAVLQMNPAMDHGQWLLITLTAGVGGSLLSVGSAAGVALMGASKGGYTFFGHLRWTWAIALGFAASVATHLWINAAHFTG
ncbi:sodium:proton antiporter NhaD [Arenimonas sp.]|uniref:sodium:proton antiporter NhaD n=1 Tax=Arenimonas sp. TaxID=1872635 RepID=UPI0039E5BF84